MTVSLPYSESFDGSNGSAWPSVWVIPSPEGLQGGSADVQSGRGRITLTPDWFNGTPQFSARLVTVDASTFDLTFTLDISAIEAALNQQDTGFWVHVKLANPAAGVDYYEIYFDPFNEGVVQAAIYKWTGAGSFADTTATGGYVSLPGVSPSQPISVRIRESGTTRTFKVWQGAQPGAWTIVDSAAPVHSGPRYIDLSTFAQVGTNASIFLDDIVVNGSAIQPLPYYEPFNYTDGASWPLGDTQTPGWLIPSPLGMSGSVLSVNVNGGRGEIEITPDWVGGLPQISTRLVTENAPTYDLSFTVDLFELQPVYGGYPDNRDGYYFAWFHVQLEDQTAGTVFYELGWDADYDLDAGLTTPKLRATIYRGASAHESLGQVNLAFDAGVPISVRIQESGGDRSFKVWQGIEPDLWTVLHSGAATHSGPRYIDFSVLSQQGGGNRSIYLDNIRANATDATGGTGNDLAAATWISVGATTHFEFFYDSALGPTDGGLDALAAMVNAEADLQNHFNWWGSMAPWSNGPERLAVRFISPAHNSVQDANAYYDRTVESVFFIWDKADPASSTYCSIDVGWRGEFVHELGHHFQRLSGDKWGFAASMLEAQATFLDREFRRQIGDIGSLQTSGYGDGVTFWIQADPQTRADYLNTVVQTSGAMEGPFGLALGCELLFFNYLRWHRGYSPAAITRAAGTTMRRTYENLTGDKADPFPKFLAEIDIAFPRGQYFAINPPWYLGWPSKDLANPYPLPGSAGITVPGGGAGVAFVNGLPATAQALKQFLRRG